jgi:hypothetical protein
MGGLGLQDLYALQGAYKTMMILEHIRCNSTLGQMIYILTLWTQKLLGTKIDILREPNRCIPPTAGDMWIRGVRNYLADSKCQLLIQPTEKETRPMAPRRINDIAIMDLALQSKVSDAAMQSIQKVRLFLQVDYISDVFNARGDQILPEVTAQ